MTEYIYLPTPISEKPKELHTKYPIMLNSGAYKVGFISEEGKWYIANPDWWKYPVTEIMFWLRKVPRLEYDREVAGKAWKKGRDYGVAAMKEHHGGPENELPDLQTYLETL